MFASLESFFYLTSILLSMFKSLFNQLNIISVVCLLHHVKVYFYVHCVLLDV